MTFDEYAMILSLRLRYDLLLEGITMSLKYPILCVLLLWTLAALSQDPQNNPTLAHTPELRQEGNMFTVRIVMGEPMRIFVLGKEEAKLDLSQLHLTVRRLQPYPAKMLTARRNGDYYIVTDLPASERTGDWEVTTKLKNKTETLRFKLQNQKP